MKGITFKIILGIILLLLVAYIYVSGFIVGLVQAGEDMGGIKDFRWYCMYWSEDGYQGKSVEVKGDDVYMHPYCTKELGVLCPIPNDGHGGCMPPSENDPLWEKCRDACKLEKTEG